MELFFVETPALLGEAPLLLGEALFEVSQSELHTLLKQLDLAADDLRDLRFDRGLFRRVILRLAVLIAEFVQALLILELSNDGVGQLRATLAQLEVLDRHRGHASDQHLETPGVFGFQVGETVETLRELVANEFHDLVDHLRRNRPIHQSVFPPTAPITPTGARTVFAESTSRPVTGSIEVLSRPAGRRILRLRRSDSALGRRKKKDEGERAHCTHRVSL